MPEAVVEQPLDLKSRTGTPDRVSEQKNFVTTTELD